MNLLDAIAILKMTVGLDINEAGRPLSPFQALAADVDGNGRVEQADAITLLMHIVGLPTPSPTWHFVNEADTSLSSRANLTPGVPPTISADLLADSAIHFGLAAYLSGDVDGSYVNLGNPTLPLSYFSNHGLNPAQFGIYV